MKTPLSENGFVDRGCDFLSNLGGMNLNEQLFGTLEKPSNSGSLIGKSHDLHDKVGPFL